ncbi:unnamed protein product [Schistosoma intercalatum]|nr:unnamed protein product [Schistosoma intercalatum]
MSTLYVSRKQMTEDTMKFIDILSILDNMDQKIIPWSAKSMEFTLNKSWKQWLCATRLGYDLKDDLSLALHLLQLFRAETAFHSTPTILH